MLQLEINEDERDCLQELMNIAYGSATAAISTVLDAFATLMVPDIKIIESSELKNYLSENLNFSNQQFVVTQLLSGQLAGENLFLIDTQSATNLAYEFDLEEDEINNDELKDIVLEITNILSSSMIGKLVEELGSEVSFSPPNVHIINSVEDIDNRYSDEYNQIIIISTNLVFEEQNIKGEILLLTKDDSIIWLKEELNRILDEF